VPLPPAASANGAASAASLRWTRAICHAGYLVPAIDGVHLIGATYDRDRPRHGADPADDQGLYAALPSVHRQLDKAFLTEIYNNGQAVPQENMVAAAERSTPSQRSTPTEDPRRLAALTADNLPGLSTSAPGPHEISKNTPRSKTPKMQLTSATTAGLSDRERAALAEIQNRSERAEVVCVIRSLDEPNSKSEIIILDSASPEFLQKLAGEQQAQAARHLTSLNVRDRQIPMIRQPAASPRPQGDNGFSNPMAGGATH